MKKYIPVFGRNITWNKKFHVILEFKRDDDLSLYILEKNGMELDDNSLMPFGKYKGTKMIDVPASYLIWLYENKKYNTVVKDYIEDNMDVLKEQIKR